MPSSLTPGAAGFSLAGALDCASAALPATTSAAPSSRVRKGWGIRSCSGSCRPRNSNGKRLLESNFPGRKREMRFKVSPSYVSTADLTLAVNAAIALQRPLLVKGEPGTGKIMLAVEVAIAIGVPLLEWHLKSTTKAQQGLYEYDAVSRLRD